MAYQPFHAGAGFIAGKRSSNQDRFQELAPIDPQQKRAKRQVEGTSGKVRF
jgi:hypothetical protein